MASVSLFWMRWVQTHTGGGEKPARVLREGSAQCWTHWNDVKAERCGVKSRSLHLQAVQAQPVDALSHVSDHGAHTGHQTQRSQNCVQLCQQTWNKRRRNESKMCHKKVFTASPADKTASLTLSSHVKHLHRGTSTASSFLYFQSEHSNSPRCDVSHWQLITAVTLQVFFFARNVSISTEQIMPNRTGYLQVLASQV